MSGPDEVVARFLAGGRASGRLHPRYAELWDDVARTASGGKRFRPALLMTVHELLGGTGGEVAAEVAGAIELLHTGFLMHDDVIDGDRTRHGRLNVSGAGADRARALGADSSEERLWADTAGILAGDLALIGAVRTVALCGADPRTVRRLLDLLDTAVHASAAGELRDVQLPLDDKEATVAEVLAVAELKTAAYSFQLPLQAGAVLAGSDEELVAGLRELGRLLGVAYQLHDDLVGTFGDEEQSGKSVRSDLREGKRTPLIVHASSTPWWPTIAACVDNRGTTDVEVALVRSTLDACGSRTFVEELADRHLSAAWALSDDLGLPASFLDQVAALTRNRARSVAA